MLSFHYDKSFEVSHAILLRNDLAKITTRSTVVIDFRDVQFATQAAIDALVAALKSLTGSGRRILGVGFEGIGLEQFRAIGVVC